MSVIVKGQLRAKSTNGVWCNVRRARTCEPAFVHECCYLLWTAVGGENSDVNGDNGDDDAEERDGRKFADELDPEKHPDEHDDEQDRPVQSVVVELYALIYDVPKQCHWGCDVQL